MERGRLHTRVARQDRDGRRHAREGGRDVAESRYRSFVPPMIPREDQTLAGEGLLTRYVNFVRLPHTVFALPFALIGVVLASFIYPITLRTLGLVVLAFTAGRVLGVGFNPLPDRGLHARNPRPPGGGRPPGRATLGPGMGRRLGRAVLRGRGRGRGVDRLRASPGAPGRPFTPQCGVLHRERHRERGGVRRCTRGSGPVKRGTAKRPPERGRPVPRSDFRVPRSPSPPRHPVRSPTPNRRGR